MLQSATRGTTRRVWQASSIQSWAVPRSSPFTTSSASPFLFRRPPPADTKRVLGDMMAAKEDDRLDLVAKLYPQLVSSLQNATGHSARPSQARLHAIMRFVASTNRFSLLLRMFNDMPAVFGYSHSSLDHHLLLLGMARAGKVHKALDWIESMSTTHDIRPSTSDWNVVLGGFRAQKDLDGMRHAIGRMEAQGYSPNVVTFNTLISALFELGHVDQVRNTVKDMADKGIEPNVWTETTLLTGFLDAGELASAKEMQARLLQRVEADHEAEEAGASKADTAAVNALIKFETAQAGFEAGLALARRYRDRGFALDAWTMNTLAVNAAKQLSDAAAAVRLIEGLEAACDLEADRRTWSAAVRGVLAGPGGTAEALKLHQEARDRSVEPDSTMIQPLLNALLLPSPTPESLTMAKELYEDLSQASRAYHTSPDISIYVTLLRACADRTHPDLEYSRTLIADMRERGLRLDGPTLTWHIIALMRAASSFEEAFAAYDQMRALDPSALDKTSSYNTILAAFTSLSFPDTGPAPTAMIMEFLSDMRHSNPPAAPDSTTYSQLLSYYSRSATASASQIAHLHSLIKLDINLDPDTALFNALMAAYSRVGAYAAALRIWDTMRANARGGNDRVRVDARSVSIVLDTSGYEGSPTALVRAKRIWDEVGKGGIQDGRNLKNWDSWVECLCRLGQYDEAERAVFQDMTSDGVGVRPEMSTLSTLLKMVRRADDGDLRWERIRERVRHEMPEMWDSIKNVATRPSVVVD